MSALLFFAFVSGLVTIFAPCIWPILPIILSASTTGGRRKPLGIVLGIMLSFATLTLTLSYIVRIFSFDPSALRFVAVIVIGFLGLMLVVPALSAKFEVLISRLSGKFGGVQKHSQSTGFLPGFITGCSLGIIWTPCAGPILAAVATLSATQSVSLSVIFIVLSYVAGVGIPLFLFATLGQRFFAKSRLLNKYTGHVQRIFGVIMLFTALFIATGYDKTLQVKLLDAFPSIGHSLTGIEDNDTVKNQLKALKENDKAKKVNMKEGDTVNGYSTEGTDKDAVQNARFMNQSQSAIFNENYNAPSFSTDGTWLNTSHPLSVSELKGKVVLVDFWTYSCINCIRTLPHVVKWYDEYKDKGLVVIGVHTPEFEFEKNSDNVQNALKKFGIRYPVMQDNDYATWKNYNNVYWPAQYLIDTEGRVRRTHFGEGEYQETQSAIIELLKDVQL